MMRIAGTTQRYCDGIGRRDFLSVGTLGLGGLTMADLLRCRAQAAPSSPRLRAVIMIVLQGGLSHIDSYDLKPDSPSEYRGEFQQIRTKVPGLDICELMPRQAAIADKLAVVRSLQTVDPNHILLEGKRVIVDATFGADAHRRAFLSLAARLCVPCLLLHCRAAPELVRLRLLSRHGDASDADWRVHGELAQVWESPSEIVQSRWHEVDTGRSIDEVMIETLRILQD